MALNVPYSPVPTERPSGQGIPEVHVPTPGAAFGTTVGAGIEGIGKSIEHAGDELFKRALAFKALENETEAKEADAKYMIEAGKLHADFSAKQGQQAVAAFPKYQQDLDQLRVQMRDGLSNDAARKMFDSSALSTMGRTIFNGAGHAATEQKRWVNGASVGRIDAARDNAYHNPNDDIAFERGVRMAEQEVRGTQSTIHGWSPEQTTREAEKTRSSMIAARIAGMARTEPFKAKEILDANKDRLHGDDLPKTEQLVMGQMRTAGARVISGEVNPPIKEGESGPSLQERIDAGMLKAEQTAPDDPLLKDYVRDRIISDFNRQKSIKRDFDYENRNIIEGAIAGSIGEKIPTTVEELINLNPKIEQAWNNLDATHQKALRKALAANAKGDHSWSDESLKRYAELKGLAHENPEKFLDTIITDETMPNSAKRELINLQQKVKTNPEGDPRLTRALNWLSLDLRAAKIGKTQNADRYYRFIGGLQDALLDFQQEKKRPPNIQEVKEIGNRLLQTEVTTSPGFIWPSKDKLYNVPVPKTEVERIKTNLMLENEGRVPTDAAIRRAYAFELYKKLHTSDTKPTVVPTFPNPPKPKSSRVQAVTPE